MLDQQILGGRYDRAVFTGKRDMPRAVSAARDREHFRGAEVAVGLPPHNADRIFLGSDCEFAVGDREKLAGQQDRLPAVLPARNGTPRFSLPKPNEGGFGPVNAVAQDLARDFAQPRVCLAGEM